MDDQLPLENQKQKSEGDEDTSFGDGVKDDLDYDLNGDAGWRRCTTADEDTTDCSWEEFQTDDGVSAKNGFARVLYTLCPYPMSAQDANCGMDDLNYDLDGDAGWRRCSTGDENTTECFVEEFSSYGGGVSLHHAFGDGASSVNDGFAHVLYTLCPNPTMVQDTTARSDNGSDEVDHAVQ